MGVPFKSPGAAFFRFHLNVGARLAAKILAPLITAFFAACLIGSSQYILLDEPLEGMDLRVQKRIIDWITLRLKEGVCMMVVSHSIEPFLELTTRALTFKEGQAFLFETLPTNLKEKQSFIENLAQGILLK